MNTTFKILAAALFLSMTACQQDYASKSLAMQTAETYVTSVSRAFAKKTTSSSNRAVVSNFDPYSSGGYNTGGNLFDPFGGAYNINSYAGPASSAQPWQQQNWGGQWGGVTNSGTYGNYLMYPSMTDETNRCQQMVQSIPAKLENLDFMMGTLERCLYRLAIHKSAPMNHLWRNDNPQILNYAGYLNDYARPAQYGQYAQDPYNQFLLNGQTSYLQSSGLGQNSYYPSGM